jgi:hypothetical protein
MSVENYGGMILTRKTEELGENLSQYHFVHHKSHMNLPSANARLRGERPATNRLSHGMARHYSTYRCLEFLTLLKKRLHSKLIALFTHEVVALASFVTNRRTSTLVAP